MQRCLELARLGEFTARPNPLVGALLLASNGTVYEGHHECYGEAHAEINALDEADDQSRGGTLYVSLEPCSFQGKTGPCSERIIASGVRRVVIGMVDPNPKVAGRGIKQLQQAGIEVSGPLMEAEARALNPGFIKRMQQGLPHVRIKLAMSLDGRTAMASGESQWITGPEARADVQLWRARSDAIVTGVDTVLADDPGMNVRLDIAQLRQPLRVIVDSRLRTSPDARILQLPGRSLLVTALPETQLEQRRADFSATDTTLLSFPGDDAAAKVDLQALLQHLALAEECGDILVESGPTLAGAVIRAGLGDELLCYIAPKLLGSEARPLMHLPGLKAINEHISLQLLDVEIVGKDCRMRSLIL